MKSLYFEDDIFVSTHDIDFAGHVSNIVYLRWLEDMRLKMLDKYCPLQGFMADGISPILTSTEIKYKKSIRLFEKPKAKIWVSSLSKATFTIEAEIHVAGEQTTWAKFTGIFVDVNAMRPIRIPANFLQLVQNTDMEPACSV
ncbi:MAG: acyl-CoA thioesterase [Candidatus Obscuribacterales bacterium]|nr:acyl-CoA thioesterase [Candidatus Obscuribacterales bacterium]